MFQDPDEGEILATVQHPHHNSLYDNNLQDGIFFLNAQFIQKLQIEEARWRRKINAWSSSTGDIQRRDLWEIRSIACAAAHPSR